MNSFQHKGFAAGDKRFADRDSTDPVASINVALRFLPVSEQFSVLERLVDEIQKRPHSQTQPDEIELLRRTLGSLRQAVVG